MAPKAALPMLLHVPKRLRPLRDVCCMGAALRWQRRAWNVCAGFSRPPVGKAWNSKQMAGIHSCQVVRTLFAAEGNVAHGRGQRCTRSCATHHQAFRDAKAHCWKDFRPFPHKCISQKEYGNTHRKHFLPCLFKRASPHCAKKPCLPTAPPPMQAGGRHGRRVWKRECVREVFIPQQHRICFPPRPVRQHQVRGLGQRADSRQAARCCWRPQ